VKRIVPVILSGGVGSRLWPTSRALYPKQLLPLISDRGMLQETAARVGDADLFSAPIVISNEDHRFIIAAQLQEIRIEAALHVLEPTGRNTAPAAAAAAISCDPDDVLLVLPADHHIEDHESFLRAVEVGRTLSEKNHLVTFGIVPTGPETGYGYIRQAEALEIEGAFGVAEFVEKPAAAIAQSYLEVGGYHWNSGIFMFRADCLLTEMERFCPEILSVTRTAMAKGVREMDFVRLDAKTFDACPADSIDYAIMERTDKAAIIPVTMGWNDIGSWSSLWDIGEKDEDGNVRHGDVISVDSRNNYIRAESCLVATLGLEDVIVVETGDAVLVADKAHVQDIKSIVTEISSANRKEHIAHNRVHRPWGYYESLTNGDCHQVKHLMVSPGASLSLQLHNHRAEHWVVVKGTAKVTVGDEVSVLKENQSTYIPVKTKHRLENPFDEPVSIIEVQSGSYLGEDDIVRFEDIYGRSK